MYYVLENLGLEGRNSDSAVPGLNRNAVYALPVVIPPDSVEMQFGQLVESLYQKIWHNDQESRTLAELRDTLLPKLISGEVRVGQMANGAIRRSGRRKKSASLRIRKFGV